MTQKRSTNHKMTQKKANSRKITRSYYRTWPEDSYGMVSNFITKKARENKYVRFGVTTDCNVQYDQHFLMDKILWQRMHVILRSNDVRAVKRFLKVVSQDERYIDNNIRFPETLFDKAHTYYVYVLVGKRKKGKNADKRKGYTYIDLYAGLGGFNIALSKLGCTCVFASVAKDDLRWLYAVNHNVKGTIAGNLNEYDLKKIPHHDILCATLMKSNILSIGKVIKAQGQSRPRFLLFESDTNIRREDNGHTWNILQETLYGLGYDMKTEIISPHQFGIPLHRPKLYLVGIRHDMADLASFSFPFTNDEQECDIHSIIIEQDDTVQPLTLKQYKALKVWQYFLDECHSRKVQIPRFPVWADEFGATYPYRIFPRWKRYCIERNRQFYAENKTWLDTWKESIRTLDSSHRKMEWNVGGGGCYQLKDNILQFLASGIRVKTPTYSPALFGSLLPIIPWAKVPQDVVSKYPAEGLEKYSLTTADVEYGRYLTVHEAARLQGLESLQFADDNLQLSLSRTYETIGNAVNVHVVRRIAQQLLVQ